MTKREINSKHLVECVLLCVDNLLCEMQNSFPCLKGKVTFSYNIHLDSLDFDRVKENLEGAKGEAEALKDFVDQLCSMNLKKLNHIVTDLPEEDECQVSTPLHCKACRLKFTDKVILDQHLEHVHNVKPDCVVTLEELPFFCCSFCSVTFRESSELEKHQCSSSPVSIHSVPIPQVRVLKKHKRFVCGYCQEEFRQFSRITHHFTLCKGGPLPCELCHISFETKPGLNSHKSNMHKCEKSFFCRECPLTFKLNTSLQKHIIQKHEKSTSETSFPCDKCPKKFIKKLYLTHHKTRFHNLSKPFLCLKCGEGFLSTKSLKVHEDNHTNPKRFECQNCEKKFSRKDKLDAHLSTHTGIRPFHCQLCNRNFGTKSKLNEHQRRHLGEKRFSCLVCHKKFSSFEKARRCFHTNLFMAEPGMGPKTS